MRSKSHNPGGTHQTITNIARCAAPDVRCGVDVLPNLNLRVLLSARQEAALRVVPDEHRLVQGIVRDGAKSVIHALLSFAAALEVRVDNETELDLGRVTLCTIVRDSHEVCNFLPRIAMVDLPYQ